MLSAIDAELYQLLNSVIHPNFIDCMNTLWSYYEADCERLLHGTKYRPLKGLECTMDWQEVTRYGVSCNCNERYWTWGKFHLSWFWVCFAGNVVVIQLNHSQVMALSVSDQSDQSHTLYLYASDGSVVFFDTIAIIYFWGMILYFETKYAFIFEKWSVFRAVYLFKMSTNSDWFVKGKWDFKGQTLMTFIK